MTLQIKCGLRTATRQYGIAPTVADIKRDNGLRLELGYGDNVRVLVNDTEQPDFVQIPGNSCTVETKANEKN